MGKQSFRITKPIKEKQNQDVTNVLKELLSSSKINETLDSLSLQIKKVNEEKQHKEKTKNEVVINYKSVNHTKTLKNQKNSDIINKFTEALMTKKIDTLKKLLDNKGKYIMLNDAFELKTVNKSTYIKYLKIKLQTQNVTEFKNDFCNGCHIGHNIILYNNGSFPWDVLKNGFGVKAAFLFNVSNGLITSIRFCHTFRNTEDWKTYQNYRDIYAKYRELGYDIDETIRLAREEWDK